jgi:phospholipid/cholesterol/gamma-HCH transport system substrate-binding protein
MVSKLRSDIKQIIIGGIFCGAALFGILYILLGHKAPAYDTANSYVVSAVFSRADGVLPHTQVRLSGITVGSVDRLELLPDYTARVYLSITRHVRLPTDTSATIETDGLLGGKYIELVPGGDEDFIHPGGRIDHTQGSIMLDELLQKVIALIEMSNNKDNKE